MSNGADNIGFGIGISPYSQASIYEALSDEDWLDYLKTMERERSLMSKLSGEGGGKALVNALANINAKRVATYEEKTVPQIDESLRILSNVIQLGEGLKSSSTMNASPYINTGLLGELMFDAWRPAAEELSQLYGISPEGFADVISPTAEEFTNKLSNIEIYPLKDWGDYGRSGKWNPTHDRMSLYQYGSPSPSLQNLEGYGYRLSRDPDRSAPEFLRGPASTLVHEAGHAAEDEIYGNLGLLDYVNTALGLNVDEQSEVPFRIDLSKEQDNYENYIDWVMSMSRKGGAEHDMLPQELFADLFTKEMMGLSDYVPGYEFRMQPWHIPESAIYSGSAKDLEFDPKLAEFLAKDWKEKSESRGELFVDENKASAEKYLGLLPWLIEKFGE